MSAEVEFGRLADRIVDQVLAVDPVAATWLGDHRFDGELPDRSAAAVAAAVRAIDSAVAELDAIDDLDLDTGDQVDLEICRAGLQRLRFDLAEERRHEWDPLTWNPGTALYLLVAREVGPVPERAQALRARLAAVPDLLATARGTLGDLPQVHVETAVAQLAGTRALIDGPVRALAQDDAGVETALRSVGEFADWLSTSAGDRDPRLGPRLFAGALWHRLDDTVGPDELLAAAHDRLAAVTEEMVDLARRYLGTDVRDPIATALADIAEHAPAGDVLGEVERALARTTAFVAEHGLVSVPDLDVRVIEMPELHRGVAVAYCDAPGPLETAHVPTFVAVAPTPTDWPADRVASFRREYNAVQLHVLTVHEAMPGHVLQLARAADCRRPTRVRAAGRSGTFVEGWAVFAEQVVADAGYAPDGDERSALAFALQQRKTALRVAVNAILDVGVHAHGMDEADAMALMCERGFQERGEAAGKWRRALLTAGQLSTYFAGHRAVASIASDLRVLHPQWTDAQVHDLLLAHGSPAPRHLRTLLGL